MKSTELSHDAFVQMAQIASRYFEKGEKQDVIAKDYNLSQAEVSRCLREARHHNIVRIEVDPYYLRKQEQDLRTRFPHLKEVILRPAFQVAQSNGDNALLEALGTACADYFLQIVGHNATLGISCGLAVEAFTNAVGRHSATSTTVLPVACEIYSLLTLMASEIQGLTPAGLVANLTRWLPDSTGYAFHLPHDAIQGIRAYLDKGPIQQLQQALANLQYYIIGIGYIEQIKTRQRIGRVHNRVSYEFNALIERFIGKYLSSLGKLDDIVTPEKGFETQL
jgi:DNA-binding transcriptional regulator LsrR (DeoR family)